MVVFDIEDRASRAINGLEFDLEGVGNILKSSIRDSDKFRLAGDNDTKAYRAEMTIALASQRESVRPEEDGIYRAVQVDLSFSREDKGVGLEEFSVQGKSFLVQDPGSFNQQEGFEKVLQMAIAEAVRLMAMQLRAKDLPGSKITALLASDDPQERLYVLRALRERREPELVPKIVEMLSDPDSEVVLEAVGVLVAQRDQRAVVPLIRISTGRDHIFLRQIITALREIGGPVARGFLFTLAAGHNSPDIRNMAGEALKSVERAIGERSDNADDKAVATPYRGPDGADQPRRGVK